MALDRCGSRGLSRPHDLPDGQINASGGGLPVQPLLQKYFCFPEPQIKSISPAIPSHTEGRLMIVTAAGRDAVDAAASGARIARWTNDAFADGEVVWSWRPDAGV